MDSYFHIETEVEAPPPFPIHSFFDPTDRIFNEIQCFIAGLNTSHTFPNVLVFRYNKKTAKSDYELRHVCPLCLPVCMEELSSHWMDSV